MPTRNILLAPMLALCSFIVQAASILDDDSSDDRQWQPEKPFEEAVTSLPDSINMDDLQEFHVGANDPHFRYYIERGSLQTASDRVTRFVVVIRSHTGVINSSYEGLRCGERLFKVYAYGGAEKFYAATDSAWRDIPKDESTDYRAALYDDLICNLLTGKSNQPDAIFRAMGNQSTLGSD
ncbi:MAG: CNP1-like family protein [Candidatus Thiodiazotropha sp.]